jgi:excisionase family DNA binding protein
MEPLEPLLTTEDVAKILNVEVITVRRLISRGELGAYRVGGEFRFKQQDLGDYLDRQRVKPDQPQRQEAAWWGRFSFDLKARPNVPKVLDRFTKRAKQVLSYAQEEAQHFNHPYIGTEHLLLGLIRDEDGIAGKVLSDLGIQLEQTRQAAEQIVGHGEGTANAERGFELTASAKKTLEFALEESARLHHHYVGSEHLLLGITRKGEGVAAGVLERMGVNLEQMRTRVLRELRSGPTDQADA